MSIKRRVICECGGDYYDRDWDFSTTPNTELWECLNCGRRSPRRARAERKTDTVTRSQRLLSEAIKRRGMEKGDVWTEWLTELTDYGTLVVRGTLHNPEGREDTLFDTTVQLFVSRRGGVTGTVYAGFGGSRELKTRRDLWMVYR